jgi:hypothetical protein
MHRIGRQQAHEAQHLPLLVAGQVCYVLQVVPVDVGGCGGCRAWVQGEAWNLVVGDWCTFEMQSAVHCWRHSGLPAADPAKCHPCPANHSTCEAADPTMLLVPLQLPQHLLLLPLSPLTHLARLLTHSCWCRSCSQFLLEASRWYTLLSARALLTQLLMASTAVRLCFLKSVLQHGVSEGRSELS